MKETINILLADDDEDDCNLFKEALDEIVISTNLKIAYDGESLLQELRTSASKTPLVFLDLNMPRKNGVNCMSEIKADEKLKNIPVIILSTSLEPYMIKHLYELGALYCIRKPNDFDKLKNLIKVAIKLVLKNNHKQPSEKDFVLYN